MNSEKAVGQVIGLHVAKSCKEESCDKVILE